MFVVAVTLGLLAAMGVYGLSATAMDIRAAGHFRENAQAQSAAEHAIMLTAETFTPGTAGEIVRDDAGWVGRRDRHPDNEMQDGKTLHWRTRSSAPRRRASR